MRRLGEVSHQHAGELQGSTRSVTQGAGLPASDHNLRVQQDLRCNNGGDDDHDDHDNDHDSDNDQDAMPACSSSEDGGGQSRGPV